MIDSDSNWFTKGKRFIHGAIKGVRFYNKIPEKISSRALNKFKFFIKRTLLNKKKKKNIEFLDDDHAWTWFLAYSPQDFFVFLVYLFCLFIYIVYLFILFIYLYCLFICLFIVLFFKSWLSTSALPWSLWWKKKHKKEWNETKLFEWIICKDNEKKIKNIFFLNIKF